MREIQNHASGGSRGGAREARAQLPLFLDETEARRAEKKFFDTGAPLSLSLGLNDLASPLIWRSRYKVQIITSKEKTWSAGENSRLP